MIVQHDDYEGAASMFASLPELCQWMALPPPEPPSSEEASRCI